MEIKVNFLDKLRLEAKFDDFMAMSIWAAVGFIALSGVAVRNGATPAAQGPAQAPLGGSTRHASRIGSALDDQSLRITRKRQPSWP